MGLVRSNTAEGREVLAYADERIDGLHKQLEAVDLDEGRTQVIRGRISELRKLKANIEHGELKA